jgi:hypothetical protein
LCGVVVLWLCCGCVVCRMMCEVTRRENEHIVGYSPAIPHIFGIPRSGHQDEYN